MFTTRFIPNFGMGKHEYVFVKPVQQRLSHRERRLQIHWKMEHET